MGAPWNRPGTGPERIETFPTVTWFGVTPMSEAVPPLGGAVVDAALVVVVEELLLELPPPQAAATRPTVTTITGSPSPLLSLTSLSLL